MQWQQGATLTANDSGKFENRWEHLRVDPRCPSPLVQEIEQLYLPVRHGEGKFVPWDTAVLQKMQAQGQAAPSLVHNPSIRVP
jgi:phosphoribosylformylglycinamidine synthase